MNDDPQLLPELIEIIQPVDISLLETYEDHLSAAIEQLNRRNSSAWGLADILISLITKFGEPSQIAFATQLEIPRSTVTNYIRTAKAFPPAKRLPEISFTHHMEASFADSYDEKRKTFLSETRFDWAERAVDQKLKTRHLASKIKQEKQKTELHVAFLPCYICGEGDAEVLEFVILSRDPNSSRRTADQFLLHKQCYDVIKNLIENAKIKK